MNQHSTLTSGLAGLACLLASASSINADDAISRSFTIGAPPHTPVVTTTYSRSFTLGAPPHDVAHVQVVSRAFTLRWAVDPSCPDFDLDDEVGFEDLLRVLQQWGPCGKALTDVDGDGETGFPDLLVVLLGWGPC